MRMLPAHHFCCPLQPATIIWWEAVRLTRGGSGHRLRLATRSTPLKVRGCTLLFPLAEAGNPPGNVLKMGKITEIPFPLRPAKGKEKWLRKCNFRSHFSAIFPNFGGRTGEQKFAAFPHFSGISAPEAFPTLKEEKKNSQVWGETQRVRVMMPTPAAQTANRAEGSLQGRRGFPNGTPPGSCEE